MVEGNFEMANSVIVLRVLLYTRFQNIDKDFFQDSWFLWSCRGVW